MDSGAVLSNVANIMTIVLGIITLPTAIINLLSAIIGKSERQIIYNSFPTIIIKQTVNQYFTTNDFSSNYPSRSISPAFTLILALVIGAICVFCFILFKFWVFILALALLAIIMLNSLTIAVRYHNHLLLIKTLITLLVVIAYLVYLWFFPFVTESYNTYMRLVMQSSNLLSLLRNVESDTINELLTICQISGIGFLVLAFYQPYITQAICYIKRRPMYMNRKRIKEGLFISIVFSTLIPFVLRILGPL